LLKDKAYKGIKSGRSNIVNDQAFEVSRISKYILKMLFDKVIQTEESRVCQMIK